MPSSNAKGSALGLMEVRFIRAELPRACLCRMVASIGLAMQSTALCTTKSSSPRWDSSLFLDTKSGKILRVKMEVRNS